jgi:hypothetical protein
VRPVWEKRNACRILVRKREREEALEIEGRIVLL